MSEKIKFINNFLFNEGIFSINDRYFLTSCNVIGISPSKFFAFFWAIKNPVQNVFPSSSDNFFSLKSYNIIFFMSLSFGSSTIKYIELLIKFPDSFSLGKSFVGLNIPIKFTFPLLIFEPLGINMLVPSSPKIEFKTSKTAGLELLMPSIRTNLLGTDSLLFMAWHKSVSELTKVTLPFSFFFEYGFA